MRKFSMVRPLSAIFALIKANMYSVMPPRQITEYYAVQHLTFDIEIGRQLSLNRRVLHFSIPWLIKFYYISNGKRVFWIDEAAMKADGFVLPGQQDNSSHSE